MKKLGDKQKACKTIRRKATDYDRVYSSVVELLDASRRASARMVNALMTATYWEIGRRIVEHEQAGEKRAGYGEELIEVLSGALSKKYGRGFGVIQLRTMRQFYLLYATPQKNQSSIGNTAIREPAVDQSPAGVAPSPISQSPIDEFNQRSSKKLSRAIERLGNIGRAFPLPWTHYVRLLRVRNALGREFYEREALAGGWSVRQLNRQINAQFYERSVLSENKIAMLEKSEKTRPGDAVSADEEIRNPLVLEFLNLRDEYSEDDLEEALIRHLETFLLELGNVFAFVGRQRRLRIGNEWFRVDLLFFHRRLRCLVIIDLKTGELDHADVGQMNLYCNFAREHWMQPGENPPVGLVLCAGKDDALARYAMEGLQSKMLVREYLTALPKESALAAELGRTRGLLERQGELRRPAH